VPCYNPLKGWRSRTANSNGKRPIVFNRSHGFEDLPVTLPCGQCIGCRLERSRQWAIRCVHESQMHDDNVFLTLTYDDQHIPGDGSLNVRDFQLFMKSLRKKFGAGIKYLQCGEYGESCALCGRNRDDCINSSCPRFVKTFGRPHHHVILFGCDFYDKKIHKTTRDGHTIYTSPTLQKLWFHGHSYIGSVSFESCAYVARYITKKINGPDSDDYYMGLRPEFITMSNGIGQSWFEEFKKDVYPGDFIVLRGKKMRVPKYYDQLLERFDKQQLLKFKVNRKLSAKEHEEDNTLRRLDVRERVKKAQISTLKRDGGL
jgi:hypothetical protein